MFHVEPRKTCLHPNDKVSVLKKSRISTLMSKRVNHSNPTVFVHFTLAFIWFGYTKTPSESTFSTLLHIFAIT